MNILSRLHSASIELPPLLKKKSQWEISRISLDTESSIKRLSYQLDQNHKIHLQETITGEIGLGQDKQCPNIVVLCSGFAKIMRDHLDRMPPIIISPGSVYEESDSYGFHALEGSIMSVMITGETAVSEKPNAIRHVSSEDTDHIIKFFSDEKMIINLINWTSIAYCACR